uniref:Uncharacterized protein n=1 Tax=Avena sativa TaxID=4498 RepID=A0ACD5XZ38_AVESA
MSLSSVVVWWQDWQLRILVLSSLFFQCILYFSSWLRKSPNLRRLRLLVWIAYIGGDAVAIYALATLFNRHKQTWDGGNSALEVLWTPVLLIHLGGQPWITSYSLEDNELWKRHTITLVSQVTVALYVFCKWWSGKKMLLAAAILLFVLGIIRFAQKPWALRVASFNTMQASITVSPPAAQKEAGCISLEEYVQAAKKCALETKECLGATFNFLYTKVGSVVSNLGVGLMLLLPFLAFVSTVLFATSHKDGHNEKDIKVTYILLSCTTVLEFWFPCILICSPCWRSIDKFYSRGWHDMVSQHNLISFCVRKKKPTFMMKLATFNFLRDFINQHWYIQHVPTAFQVKGVVRKHMKNGWKKYICDAASYRRFSEFRGQWALRRNHQLGWSLKKPFDESVLIWHVATDLCFYHPDRPLQGIQEEATQRSKEISNYMIYLLLIRPDMLMTGTRSDIFTTASVEIMKNTKGPFDTEEMLAREILSMPMRPIATTIVSDACNLTKALMELADEKERWTVIQGVWVEMLCYSASRCRGYLHAKSLGEGGEYLSTVWLLWSFMGMETLADKIQSPEPPQEEGDKEEEAAASTSDSQSRTGQSEVNFSLV